MNSACSSSIPSTGRSRGARRRRRAHLATGLNNGAPTNPSNTGRYPLPVQFISPAYIAPAYTPPAYIPRAYTPPDSQGHDSRSATSQDTAKSPEQIAMESKPVPPPSSDQLPPSAAFFDENIEIRVGVGDNQQSFHMQKGLLCFYSGYFKAALNGKFAEAEMKVIELKTEDPAIFRRFGYWVYTRRLLEPSQTSTQDVDFGTLIKLWIFGDAHEMPLLQNEVLNFVHEKICAEWTVPTGQLRYIYEHTVVNSKLRVYMVDIMSATGQAAHFLDREGEKNWPRDALLDLARLTWKDDWKHQKQEEVLKWDMCAYHVHEEGVKCAEAKKEVSKATPSKGDKK